VIGSDHGKQDQAALQDLLDDAKNMADDEQMDALFKYPAWLVEQARLRLKSILGENIDHVEDTYLDELSYITTVAFINANEKLMESLQRLLEPDLVRAQEQIDKDLGNEEKHECNHEWVRQLGKNCASQVCSRCRTRRTMTPQAGLAVHGHWHDHIDLPVISLNPYTLTLL
jgi:hypothetical protein